MHRQFTEGIEDFLRNNNQQTYVCGDFIIDLIKYKQYDEPVTLLNKMFFYQDITQLVNKLELLHNRARQTTLKA